MPDEAAEGTKTPEAPGREGWPSFARGYPDDAELAVVVEAFARGDFGAVRRLAPKLAEAAKDPDVARAARDLRARIEPDPLAIWIVAGAGLLLLFLVIWFYVHKP